MFLKWTRLSHFEDPGASSSCYMSFGMILADYSAMESKDYWPMLCSTLETAIFSNCWSLSVQRSQCQHWSTALLIQKWIHGQWSTVSLKYRQVTVAENIPLAMHVSAEGAKYASADCCSLDWDSLPTTPSNTIRSHCLTKQGLIMSPLGTSLSYCKDSSDLLHIHLFETFSKTASP